MGTQSGEHIGEYRLHEKLGEGGMGVVYRATSRLGGQQVALKQVHSRGEMHPDKEQAETTKTGVERHSVISRTGLAHEFQLLASLHHPNIVGVLDYGFDSLLRPYYTMELLTSPQTIIEAAHQKEVGYKIELLVQLLHALAYLHRRNILHRDIKPSNVMVVHDHVKLVDFGIAEPMGAQRDLAGTLHYMAPELLLGGRASTATDLYAVGIVAYQLFTNSLPHDSTSKTRFLERVLGDLSDQTLPPEVLSILGEGKWRDPQSQQKEADASIADLDESLSTLEGGGKELSAIVRRLIATRPEERYHSAIDVIRDLGKTTGQKVSVETAATRESFLQAAALVGREEELNLLSKALGKATRRKGSVWLLSGESGVGKSRLVKEVRTMALVRGARVVRGQGITEHTANYSLWNPVIRALCLDVEIADAQIAALKDIAPDIESLTERKVAPAPPLSPQAARARLYAAVTELLAAQRQIVVIFLEDLHWASEENIELLRHLTPHLRKLPIMIVCSYREDEGNEQLRNLPGAKQMRLERLRPDQISRLCESMLGPVGRQPGLVEYLSRHTEGNVFFLVETVRALAEMAGQLDQIGITTLPENILTGGIERIIQRRLTQIPAEFGGLLNAAAVAGRRLDIKILEYVTKRHDLSSFLLVCANAAVLEVQQGEWQFSHDKIRERLLRTQDAAETRQLHRQVAEAITAIYPGDPRQDATLGYHWEKAEFLEKAHEYYLKAGAAAARLFANVEARQYYSAALAIVDRLADSLENRRRQCDILFALLGLSIFTTAFPALVSRLESTANLFAPLLEMEAVAPGDALRFTRMQFWKGRCRLLLGAVNQSIEDCSQASILAKRYGFPDVDAVSCLMIAQSKFAQGYMKSCTEYVNRALDWLEPRAPSPDWLRAVALLGMSMVARGQVAGGFAQLDRALQAAKDPMLHATVCGYIALANIFLPDWPRVKEMSRKTIELAEQNGDLRFAASSYWYLSRAEAWLGNFEASARHQKHAQPFFDGGHPTLVQDWMMAGDAEVFLLQGQLEAAIECARHAIELASSLGSIYGQGLAHRVWACALAKATAPDWSEVDRHLLQSMEMFQTGDASLELAHTHHVAGKFAAQRGNLPESIKHFSLAIEQYEAAQLLPALANARSSMAQVSHSASR